MDFNPQLSLIKAKLFPISHMIFIYLLAFVGKLPFSAVELNFQRKSGHKTLVTNPHDFWR